MSMFFVQKNKSKNLTKIELLELNKEELADRIIQLEAHTLQLKNIILKKNNEQTMYGDCDKCKKNRSFDFSKCNTRRIFLRLAYLGGKYHGLAAQEDSTCTVEHFLFRALTKSQLIPSRDKANYHRCGRTDKGVSASGQVISILIRSRLTPEQLSSNLTDQQNELPYCRMLNRLLPNDIRAVMWLPAPIKLNGDPFSARFDCKYRTYKYWFPRNQLNITAMIQGCKLLEGSHDFRNFCKMDVANGVTSFVRHIYNATILAENMERKDDEYSIYYLKITANAFLWHQIRCIAGILFLIGNEKEDPNIIEKLLDIDNCPQKPQYNMAVESPLNLFYCSYDNIENEEGCFNTGSKNYTSTIKANNSIEIGTNQLTICKEIEESNNKLSVEKSENVKLEMEENSYRAHSNVDRSNTCVQKSEFAQNPNFNMNWIIDPDNLINVIKNFHEQWTTATIQGSMVKDIIDDLMTLYFKHSSVSLDCSTTINSDNQTIANEITHSDNKKELYAKIFRNDFLIQGVKPKTHIPLLKRATCETLENRIQHYVKKKKLQKSE